MNQRESGNIELPCRPYAFVQIPLESVAVLNLLRLKQGLCLCHYTKLACLGLSSAQLNSGAVLS